MAKVGRNEPCPCGSGRKAKRCCGAQGGPSEESLARAFLAHASREAAGELRQLPDAELLDLFEELWELPAVDLSLQVELPKLLSPALNRLCDAVADDDPEPELLDAAVGVLRGRKRDPLPSERRRLTWSRGRAKPRPYRQVGHSTTELASAVLLSQSAVRTNRPIRALHAGEAITFPCPLPP